MLGLIQLTVAGFWGEVSHFKQPFSAASITVKWVSMLKRGSEVLMYVEANKSKLLGEK